MNEFIVFEKITRIQLSFYRYHAVFMQNMIFFNNDENLLESKLKSIMLGQITICRSFFFNYFIMMGIFTFK